MALNDYASNALLWWPKTPKHWKCYSQMESKIGNEDGDFKVFHV
jgi:hypothetical protein